MRAIRRHHRERLKNKRKNYGGMERAAKYFGEKWLKQNQARVINTPTPCSCPGCGNPRNHAWFKKERLTIQERKAIEAEKALDFPSEE
jgi:hypothetical protein